MSKRRSVDQRIHDGKLAVNNARNNAEIMELLDPFNLDDQRLGEGDQICDEAHDLATEQKAEQGQKRLMSEKVSKCADEARCAYKQASKIAKIKFRKDPDAFIALELHGRRKPSLAGWSAQGLRFYDNALANDNYIGRMSYYGYTQEKLEAERELVIKLRKAMAEREVENSQAKEATAKRNAKVDEMDEWISDFKAVAKMALKNKPHLLDELGF